MYLINYSTLLKIYFTFLFIKEFVEISKTKSCTFSKIEKFLPKNCFENQKEENTNFLQLIRINPKSQQMASRACLFLYLIFFITFFFGFFLNDTSVLLQIFFYRFSKSISGFFLYFILVDTWLRKTMFKFVAYLPFLHPPPTFLMLKKCKRK